MNNLVYYFAGIEKYRIFVINKDNTNPNFDT